MLRLIKVSGQSLSPEYHEGDFVLIAKIPFFFNSVKTGDVVVFNHPQYGKMIKKVERIDQGTGELFVIGSHDSSVDSRHFGPIGREALVGKVIWHIRKPAA